MRHKPLKNEEEFNAKFIHGYTLVASSWFVVLNDGVMCEIWLQVSNRAIGTIMLFTHSFHPHSVVRSFTYIIIAYHVFLLVKNS